MRSEASRRETARPRTRLRAFRLLLFGAATLLALTGTRLAGPDQPAAGGASLQVDFSIVGAVLAPQGGKSVPKVAPAESVLQVIGAGGLRCGPGIAKNGDGDGDGPPDDDTRLLRERHRNGRLELWCINNDYFALLFVPTGGGVELTPRFIGKCAFHGGWNAGWKYIDKKNRNVVSVVWETIDTGVDDDGDGAVDQWQFNYDVLRNDLDQKHLEGGELQADGPAPGAPREKPYNFGDLLPKNPRRDDPTLALGGDPEPTCDCSDSAAECFNVPVLDAGRTEQMEIETTVFNEGPSDGVAVAEIAVEAPPECAVDGDEIIVDGGGPAGLADGRFAVRRHTDIFLPSDSEAILQDKFEITCGPDEVDTSAGSGLEAAEPVRTFLVTSSVALQDIDVEDTDPDDNVDTNTLQVAVAGVTPLPTPTPSPPGNPRVGKNPRLANLWLCNTGVPTCVNKPGGVEEVNLKVELDRAITSSAKGEQQTVGSFEFELRFDAKLLSVRVEPGALFVDRPEVSCVETRRDGAVNFRCVTKGKPPDASTGPGTLAVVRVRATPDVYSMLRANQQNGIATQLINQDCRLADLQGHPISLAAAEPCSDAAVTIRYLEGDVHADCVVDVRDQQQIAFRWGARLGQLLYNENYDLEPSAPKLGDGDIDAKDLQAVYGRHGSTCKDPHPPQPPVDPKAKVGPTPTG